jgi:cytochrome P450
LTTTADLDERLAALFASEPVAMAGAAGLFRELRERAPVHEHPLAVLFSRHADVQALLRDTANFGKGERYSNATAQEALTRMTEAEQRVYAELSDFESLQLTAADGAEHERLRGIMHRTMTPSRVAALDGSIRDAASRLLDALEGRETADLMPFAWGLPLMVVCDLLGIPETDLEAIHKWTSAIGRNKGGIPYPDAVVDAHVAMGEFRVYIDRMLAEHRRSESKSDLLAALMSAEGDRLTSDELASNFIMMLLAGHETTTNLLGVGLLELLRDREQWEALCADPDRVPAAVEELLRFVTPTQWVMRVPFRDWEYGGMLIPRGRLVFLMVAAANRDPDVFGEPERVDITRDARKALAFGLGPHFCLGASLARLEAKIAFCILIDRFPEMRLAVPYSELRWRGSARLRSLETLPVRLGGKSLPDGPLPG